MAIPENIVGRGSIHFTPLKDVTGLAPVLNENDADRDFERYNKPEKRFLLPTQSLNVQYIKAKFDNIDVSQINYKNLGLNLTVEDMQSPTTQNVVKRIVDYTTADKELPPVHSLRYRRSKAQREIDDELIKNGLKPKYTLTKEEKLENDDYFFDLPDNERTKEALANLPHQIDGINPSIYEQKQPRQMAGNFIPGESTVADMFLIQLADETFDKERWQQEQAKVARGELAPEDALYIQQVDKLYQAGFEAFKETFPNVIAKPIILVCG